jgi:TonB-dependent siderophore receptor
MPVVRPATCRWHPTFRLALLGVALAAAHLPLAYAADPRPLNSVAPRAYDIGAGPLGRALSRFAVDAGIALSFDPALTDGLSSPAVSGTYPADDVARRLLAGSGLELTPRPDGSYTLRKAADMPTLRPEATTLAAVTVIGQADSAATTEGTGSYTTRAVTLGKTQQALKDIPQSVSVLTRQRMDDQNITNLTEALINTTGMTSTKSPGPGMFMFSRGFDIEALQYDGVPVPRNVYSLGSYLTETTAIVDRMEFLRGASGLLQGANSPGGAINLVRKRGTHERLFTATGKAGSWDRYGLQLDAGGALNDEGTLRGRALIDYDRGNSFIDQAGQNTQTVYAALDYDISPRTTVGLGISKQITRSRPNFIGVPRYATGADLGLPRSTYTGSDWNTSRNEQTTLYADLAHRFDDAWSVKVSALAMNEKNASAYQFVTGAVAPDGSGPRYADYAVRFSNRNRGLDAVLTGKFDALGMKQEVLVGGNYSSYTTDDAYARLFTPGVNIFNIDTARPRQDFDSIAARGSATFSQYDVEQKGIYGTWRMQVTQPLTLIAGGRVGWYDFRYAARTGATAGAPSTIDTSAKVTPYAGAVYAINPQWSAYASYAQVFIPQTNRAVGQAILPSITGGNLEAGVKGELMDGRANASLAVFRYDQKNRAVNDYAAGLRDECGAWYCSRASGKVRSQGVEAEISGQVMTGLQLSAGYTFNTTKFLEDPDLAGKEFSTWTPKHMLRLWSDYTLPGDLNRVRVGGGVNVQSATISSDRRFELGGYSVWSTRVAYQVNRNVSVALNLNNVFDKRYYIPAYNTLTGNNYYGNPRNVMLTVRGSF